MCIAVLVAAVNSAAISDATIDELVEKIMASRRDDAAELKRDDAEVAFDGADALADAFGKREDDLDDDSLGIPADADLGFNRRGPPGAFVEETVQKKSVKTFNVNMCFYCDNNCIAMIGAANVGSYYDEIASRVGDMLNTLDPSKYAFTTAALYKLTPGIKIPYLYFKRKSDNSRGAVLLSNVNENFWNFRGLYQYSVDHGCNADFLTIAPSDNIWASNYVGGIDGIANMMAVCTAHSYSTVKINADRARMAALVGHELGHLLGMFHDGPAEDYPEATCAYFETRADPSLGAPCRAVNTACGADHGCADGANNCVMSASVGTETKFSACSAAYFDIYAQVAAIVQSPDSYSMLCIAQDKRRAVKRLVEQETIEEARQLDEELAFELPDIAL